MRIRIRSGTFALGQNCFHHGAGNIGEAEVTTLESVGEFLVLDAKQMHHCRMEIIDLDRVFDHGETQFVCFAMNNAWLDSPTRHPDGETITMVLATKIHGIRLRTALTVTGAAKL